MSKRASADARPKPNSVDDILTNIERYMPSLGIHTYPDRYPAATSLRNEGSVWSIHGVAASMALVIQANPYLDGRKWTEVHRSFLWWCDEYFHPARKPVSLSGFRDNVERVLNHGIRFPNGDLVEQEAVMAWIDAAREVRKRPNYRQELKLLKANGSNENNIDGGDPESPSSERRRSLLERRKLIEEKKKRESVAAVNTELMSLSTDDELVNTDRLKALKQEELSEHEGHEDSVNAIEENGDNEHKKAENTIVKMERHSSVTPVPDVREISGKEHPNLGKFAKPDNINTKDPWEIESPRKGPRISLMEISRQGTTQSRFSQNNGSTLNEKENTDKETELTSNTLPNTTSNTATRKRGRRRKASPSAVESKPQPATKRGRTKAANETEVQPKKLVDQSSSKTDEPIPADTAPISTTISTTTTTVASRRGRGRSKAPAQAQIPAASTPVRTINTRAKAHHRSPPKAPSIQSSPEPEPERPTKRFRTALADSSPAVTTNYVKIKQEYAERNTRSKSKAPEENSDAESESEQDDNYDQEMSPPQPESFEKPQGNENSTATQIQNSHSSTEHIKNTMDLPQSSTTSRNTQVSSHNVPVSLSESVPETVQKPIQETSTRDIETSRAAPVPTPTPASVSLPASTSTSTSSIPASSLTSTSSQPTNAKVNNSTVATANQAPSQSTALVPTAAPGQVAVPSTFTFPEMQSLLTHTSDSMLQIVSQLSNRDVELTKTVQLLVTENMKMSEQLRSMGNVMTNFMQKSMEPESNSVASSSKSNKRRRRKPSPELGSSPTKMEVGSESEEE